MTNSTKSDNYEKIEIDGEALYLDHSTGRIMKKLSKEEFRDRVLSDEANEKKRIEAINNKAMKKWNNEMAEQNKKDNAHIRKTAKGGGNVVRDELLKKFNDNLKTENFATISTGKTTIGLAFGEDHFEIKLTKKNEQLEDFTDNPAKPDVVKHEIFNIILKGIEEESVIIKNDIFIRIKENDYQVKITKKRGAIEGL